MRVNLFPLHAAAWSGQVCIIKEILKIRLDTKYLLNRQGQNFKYVVAVGEKKRDYYGLQNKELED